MRPEQLREEMGHPCLVVLDRDDNGHLLGTGAAWGEHAGSFLRLKAKPTEKRHGVDDRLSSILYASATPRPPGMRVLMGASKCRRETWAHLGKPCGEWWSSGDAVQVSPAAPRNLFVDSARHRFGHQGKRFEGEEGGNPSGTYA